MKQIKQFSKEADSQTAIKWAWSQIFPHIELGKKYIVNDLFAYLHRHKKEYWKWLDENEYKRGIYADTL